MSWICSVIIGSIVLKFLIMRCSFCTLETLATASENFAETLKNIELDPIDLVLEVVDEVFDSY